MTGKELKGLQVAMFKRRGVSITGWEELCDESQAAWNEIAAEVERHFTANTSPAALAAAQQQQQQQQQQQAGLVATCGAWPAAAAAGFQDLAKQVFPEVDAGGNWWITLPRKTSSPPEPATLTCVDCKVESIYATFDANRRCYDCANKGR